MYVTEKKDHTIIADEEDNVVKFASFLEYIVPKNFKNKNLVVDLLKYEDLTLEQLLQFLILSNKRRGDKKSFVIVNTGINYDVIPDELIVVPTLEEAGDIIQMEEIQRDLGF